MGPTNLAFHLKELAAAGLVTQAQAGRFVIYRAAYEQMNGLLAFHAGLRVTRIEQQEDQLGVVGVDTGDARDCWLPRHA